MADASVDFTDSGGPTPLSLSLKSSRVPAPGNRFKNWTPNLLDLAHSAVPVGTGATDRFLFRQDYVASFEVPYLTAADVATALRLKSFLLGGGQVTVKTGDHAAHQYTCILAPGTEPDLVLTDTRTFEYSLRLSLKNTSQAPMVADY